MELLDRIELRRFVGRELLLWLWFESELFEGTLSTKEHGSFGLWLEGRLVLAEGRESTVIKGSAPGHHREAKESLLRGKTPERAGFHLSWGDRECALTLRGDTLAFAGLSPPAKPSAPEAGPALEPARPPPKKRKKTSRAEDAIADDDAAHETFYERMHHARDIEDLVTALYRDFLALRLSPFWDDMALPALEAWVSGQPVDDSRPRQDALEYERYSAARKRAIT
jgi:hypothetical protein